MTNRPVLTAAAVLFLFFAAGLIALARSSGPGAPAGDMAVIESYTIRAAHGQLLDGPYSRFGWHHPGPIYFYALAPFYWASGGRTAGLAAGAALIDIATIALAVWAAGAAGGPVCGASVAAALTALVLRVPDVLTSAWNPHVAVLPLAAAGVFAAASVERPWILVLAALAASCAAETHVGTVPAAAMLCAFGAAAAIVRFRREPTMLWQPLAAAFAAGAAAWLPSIVEQATRRPGNFTALWTFFASRTGAGQTVRTAFLAWAGMLSGVVRPGFSLANGSPLRVVRSSAAQSIAIGEILLLIVLSAAALRARRRFDACLCLCACLASLVALWSVTRVEGELMDHEIFWIAGLGALNLAAIAFAAIHVAAATRLAGFARPASAAAVALLVVCAAAAAVDMWRVRAASRAPAPVAVAIARAATGVTQFLAAEQVRRPFVDIDQDSWSLAAGVLLQLQRAGLSYAVDDTWLPMFTGAARRTGDERLALSIAGRTRHVLLTGRPGVQAVVESDPVFVDAYRVSTKR